MIKYIILLLLVASVGFAQNSFSSVSGKVFYKNSQQPVVGASVGVAGKTLATITDQQGDFLLKYPAILQKETLTIKGLGLQTMIITIDTLLAKTADTLWVIATTDTMKLDTTYRKRLNSHKLATMILNKIPANSFHEIYQQTGFYQETLFRDSMYVKVAESLLRLEKNPMPEPSKDPVIQEKIKAIKARRFEKTGFWEEIDGLGFSNGAAILSHSLDIGIPEYFANKNIQNYIFELDSMLTSYDGKVIGTLKFSPISPKIKAARTGFMYFDTASLAVVRLTYEFTPKGLLDVVQQKIFGSKKTILKGVKGEFNYKSFNEKWYLQDASLILNAIHKTTKNDSSVLVLAMQYLTTEHSTRIGSPIKDTELLESTDSFPTGGNRYEDTLWGNFNFIKPSTEMKAIIKKD